MKVVGIIPARYDSVRLPGKVLLPLAGEPMVWHVYQRACQAKALAQVLVATDDERIRQAIQERGGQVVMTDPGHASGTDRLAEVAEGLDCDLIVNIQGDEPLLKPEIIDAAVAPFASEAALRMSTAATPVRDEAEYRNPAVVKVVVDEQGFALYFSRSPIPYFRLDTPAASPDNSYRSPQTGVAALKHIGLYVYTRDTLLWLSKLPPTALEQVEKLEQLRALGNGCPIRVVQVDYSPSGVDTLEDLERVQRLMEEETS